MYDKGYKNIYNVDISPVVIEQMAKRNGFTRPELKWEVMDVRNMSTFQTGMFDLIIDKSTIDALLCGDSAFLNTALMMKVAFDVGYSYVGMLESTEDRGVLHGRELWDT